MIRFIATGSDGVASFEGSLTLVPPSGAITGSTFFLGNEGWTINGNKVAGPATFESYSRGPLLNRYILGTDDIVDVSPNGGAGDKALWYFEAPSKYWGNFGISYGGQLSFNIGGFSGDFSKLNPDQVTNSNAIIFHLSEIFFNLIDNNILKTNVVELLCASCDGPVSRGQRLGFPLYAALKLATSSSSGNLLNTPLQLTLPLLESAGWLRDPQNVLLPWTAPTQCELIQVISKCFHVFSLVFSDPWLRINNYPGSLSLEWIAHFGRLDRVVRDRGHRFRADLQPSCTASSLLHDNAGC